jgi:hypothetical protein
MFSEAKNRAAIFRQPKNSPNERHIIILVATQSKALVEGSLLLSAIQSNCRNPLKLLARTEWPTEKLAITVQEMQTMSNLQPSPKPQQKLPRHGCSSQTRWLWAVVGTA